MITIRGVSIVHSLLDLVAPISYIRLQMKT